MKVSKHFFFVNKKEAKKTLIPCGRFQHRAKRSKSFLLLFFKKEVLPYLVLHEAIP